MQQMCRVAVRDAIEVVAGDRCCAEELDRLGG
jgi:hypothetical protein